MPRHIRRKRVKHFDDSVSRRINAFDHMWGPSFEQIEEMLDGD